MLNYTPEDPALLAGQQQGYGMIEANTSKQGALVGRLMQRYGTSNADYLNKMSQAQLRGEAAAKLKLDARLASAQLRSRMHEVKLKLLKDAYKQQQKDQRQQMWATALGSVGQIAPGVYGLAAAGPRGGGPEMGEFYTDLSGNERQQLT